MGGSAIAGDMLSALFGEKFPLRVVKDYRIGYLAAGSLVILCSYSGNTEETLNCYRQIVGSAKHTVVVSAGGKLSELAKNNCGSVKLPDGYPPRSALGYLFTAVLKILEHYELIPSQEEEIKGVIGNLMSKAGVICHNFASEQNLAKVSANQMLGKIPLIYAVSPDYSPLAYRFKCQMNENVKYPAFCHTFPEMNHNEIEAWEDNRSLKGFIPVFLNKMRQSEVYQKRLNIMKDMLKKARIEYLEFFGEGYSLFQDFFSLIYLTDMITYYLAILYGKDPTAIDYILYLKKELEK